MVIYEMTEEGEECRWMFALKGVGWWGGGMVVVLPGAGFITKGEAAVSCQCLLTAFSVGPNDSGIFLFKKFFFFKDIFFSIVCL